mmetsp:Transcript_47467/g.144479  ORF Transcript_47467/g.144479 Transcript_47467/m.144479 type:complete len:300 (+) Transcript_47467:335-1234(+)
MDGMADGASSTGPDVICVGICICCIGDCFIICCRRISSKVASTRSSISQARASMAPSFTCWKINTASSAAPRALSKSLASTSWMLEKTRSIPASPCKSPHCLNSLRPSSAAFIASDARAVVVWHCAMQRKTAATSCVLFSFLATERASLAVLSALSVVSLKPFSVALPCSSFFMMSMICESEICINASTSSALLSPNSLYKASALWPALIAASYCSLRILMSAIKRYALASPSESPISAASACASSAEDPARPVSSFANSTSASCNKDRISPRTSFASWNDSRASVAQRMAFAVCWRAM